jgi:hypothetical protein
LELHGSLLTLSLSSPATLEVESTVQDSKHSAYVKALWHGPQLFNKQMYAYQVRYSKDLETTSMKVKQNPDLFVQD